MLTERDVAVLQALVKYYVLNRPQLQQLCFPDDTSGRTTRRRLQQLVSLQLIARTRTAPHPFQESTPASVYYPARRGCEVLAEITGDERILLTPTQAPHPYQILHWLAVSDVHLRLDAAVGAQTAVHLASFLNEWDVANKDESQPEKRYRIYTLLREQPRLVCAPDAALLLSTRGHSKVYYLEVDRNTSGVRRIAATKCQGYAVMAHGGLHRRHFAEATSDAFGVILLAPTARRRDALQKALAEQPAAELWRFVSLDDFEPHKILHEPIYHTCDGRVVPLVRQD